MASFKDIVKQANTGSKIPVMQLVGSNPSAAAALSKLITAPQTSGYDINGNKDITPNNIHDFRNISDKTTQEISDARTVMQVLPDMELTAQILTSSVMSPKDMTTIELTYSSQEGLLPPEITASLNNVIRKHFDQDYKIKPLLPKMLRDIMFETGSYIAAVLPENSIDEAINGNRLISMESLKNEIDSDGSFKSLGILGPAVITNTNSKSKYGFSMEAYSRKAIDNKDCALRLAELTDGNQALETFVTVIDNPSVLKAPMIHDRLRSDKINSLFSNKILSSHVKENVSTESSSGLISDRALSGKVYKNGTFTYKPVSSIKTPNQLNRKTIGNPLVLNIPSEAAIPVFIPGNVEKQIGVFVLLDGDGNPLRRIADTDHYSQLSNRLNGNGNFASAMLNKVKSSMTGFSLNNRDHIDYATRLYGNLVEQELLERLKNGYYGKNVELGNNDEIYRIMLSRALAKQYTQLLYIPGELVTYMAFKYNDKGIGKSILEDMKILNSLRSMLLFANVMASLSNSIGKTEIKLKLDESDPNPGKTIEIAQHEIMRSRQAAFPVGSNTPSELIDYIQRSAYEISYEGHPGLPDVQMQFSEKNTSYVKPDTELDETLRKQAIMAAGLNPETVDATYQAELATSVVANNLLLAKRVMQTQDLFTPLVSDHLRKYISHSEPLISELREIINNNFDKINLETINIEKSGLEKTEDGKYNKAEIVTLYLTEFISSFEIGLPKPNSITLENQLKALETYSQALDVAIDAIISDKFFTNSTAGEIANEIGPIKEIVKAHFIRQYMADNGILPELGAITSLNSDGEAGINFFEINKNHIATLTETLSKFMINLKPFKDEADAALSAAGAETDDQQSQDTGSSDENAGVDDGFGGDFGSDLSSEEPDSSNNKFDELPTDDQPVNPDEDDGNQNA